MRGAGVDVRDAPLRSTVPASVVRVARRTGYDLEAFGRSYPLRADLADGYVTHLTSQTLATLLLSQRLPRPVVVTVHDILPYLLRDDPARSTVVASSTGFLPGATCLEARLASDRDRTIRG